jgi:N-acyl-D-amino-acid deacylase
MHDLVIRGGMVADGLGGELRRADIAVEGERIVRVGTDIGAGAAEIEAEGKIVTPGFVDLHTHYDAQATWDPILAPSAWHGITTVVTGNCGVGFAPARPQDRAWLIEIMEDVEEIPVNVMQAGLPWNWESFPEYLDALDARPHSVDIAVQMPHIALRAYVMGERAARDEEARPDDIAAMSKLLREALEAGAAGFACSRTEAHRLKDGSLVPGSMGGVDELLALAGEMRHGHGAPIQFLGNLAQWDQDFPFMKELARRSGVSIQFLMSDTNWQTKIAGVEAAAAEGLRLVGHVPPRAVGNVLQWRAGRNPFMDRPSIKAIAGLPWDAQLARLTNPAFRAQVLSENNGPGEENLPPFARIIYRGFDRMYPVEDYPDYEPDPATDSIAMRAEQAGEDPAAYAYDMLMRDNGTGMIYLALANYRAGDFSEIGQLMSHPGTVVSLSDGGAHCTRVIDASLPTFMLTHWVRDRTRGARLALGEAVKSCTSVPAAAYGFLDRGVIAPGYLADINVIDLARLRLPAPYMEFDFPAGGRRLLQKAEGYGATVKRGRVTFRNGVHAGLFPGRVVRGPQPAPAAAA